MQKKEEKCELTLFFKTKADARKYVLNHVLRISRSSIHKNKIGEWEVTLFFKTKADAKKERVRHSLFLKNQNQV